jgi:Undecaprenyl-phosphate galactose phosphotransferase WbaP
MTSSHVAELRERRLAREAVREAPYVSFYLVLSDLTMTALSLLCATWTMYLLNIFPSPLSVREFLVVLPFLLLWPLAYAKEGLYPGYGLTAVQRLQKHCSGTLFAGLVSLLVTVLVQRVMPLPNTLAALTTFYSLFFCIAGRSATKRLLLRLGRWGVPAIIIGANPTGRLLADIMLKRPLTGLKPVAFFDDEGQLHGSTVAGIPIKGTTQDAQYFIEQHALKHVFVAASDLPDKAVVRTIGRNSGPSQLIRFVPPLLALSSTSGYATGLHNTLTLEARNNLAHLSNRLIKRSTDVVGGLVGLILLSPVFLLLYVWIKLDSPGPAFYWSKRVGRDGKSFQCLKFRSMHKNADVLLKTLLEQDPLLRQEYETYHKLKNDPRVTRIGEIMRKYSLDELPQLFNVVRGDMSLVGPRPYLTGELATIFEHQKQIILEARPGMTGHWQVSERNSVRFEERLAMEEHYVRNWSIWWDILLVLQTVGIVIKPNSAH